MNDKIRALAVQSDMVFLNDNNRCVSSFIENTDITDYVEEFANLIVKECAKICLDKYRNADPLSHNAGVMFSNDIKKHFGIE